MAMWGKIFGGVTGAFMGGPIGAVIGAALGHAADRGSLLDPPAGQWGSWGGTGFLGSDPRNRQAADPGNAALRIAAKMAAVTGKRDQLFALVVVVLSAKLAKIDAPVNRNEIDAFKRSFGIPPQSAREVGRLFDQARTRTDDFFPYAEELGRAFADQPATLENALSALFAIARADGAVNAVERDFLWRVCTGFGLGQPAWERAEQGSPRAASSEPDAYAVLGLPRRATDEQVRATWRTLMREIHPDSMAARGASSDEIARSSERVARINAAWDRIKRDRGL